ncbi:MAG TPA: hypothetical protein VIY29_20720 [Ktedonobacteraceae bacterium]
MTTPAQLGTGFRRFPVSTVLTIRRLNFRQSRLTQTARVSPSSLSIVCQRSTAVG